MKQLRGGGKRGARQPNAKVTILALFVVVIAGTAVVWWSFLRSTPQKTVAAFIKAAESGDADKINSYLSAQTLRLADELEELYEDYYGATPNYVLRGLFSETTGRDILGAQTTIAEVNTHGDSATVQVEFEAEAGQFTPYRLKMTSSADLVRENGVWKIDLTGAPLFPWRDNRGRLTHTLKPTFVISNRQELSKSAKKHGQRADTGRLQLTSQEAPNG